VSQDKKFDVGSEEEEDEDKIPTVDIDSLLEPPVVAEETSNAHSTEEKEWDFVLPGTAVIIDGKKIAQKLKSLTMAQRLDLDLSSYGEEYLANVTTTTTSYFTKDIEIFPEYIDFQFKAQPPQPPFASEDSFLEEILEHADKTKQDTSSHELLQPPKNQSSSLPPSPVLPSQNSFPSSTPLSTSSPSSTSHPSSPMPPSPSPPSISNKEIVKSENVQDLEEWLDSVI